MQNKLSLFGVFFITLLICFSGCEEQGSTNAQNNYEEIVLESSVVELVNASLKLIKDQDDILRAEVQYLFHNIAGRDVQVKVKVEFYDENNNLLAVEGTKTINMPSDYSEQGISPANIITYYGENVKQVDHVKIIAEE